MDSTACKFVTRILLRRFAANLILVRKENNWFVCRINAAAQTHFSSDSSFRRPLSPQTSASARSPGRPHRPVSGTVRRGQSVTKD